MGPPNTVGHSPDGTKATTTCSSRPMQTIPHWEESFRLERSILTKTFN